MCAYVSVFMLAPCACVCVCVRVVQMTSQERAARSELESAVARLRQDVARAQEESGRLSMELDRARAEQVSMKKHLCTHDS